MRRKNCLGGKPMSDQPSGQKSRKKNTQPRRAKRAREAEPEGALFPVAGLSASAGPLVDGLPEILLVLDPKGTITFASGSVVPHAQISAADLIGKSAWEFVHPDDLADAISSLDYEQTAEPKP